MTDAASPPATRTSRRLWIGLVGMGALGLVVALAVVVAGTQNALSAWDVHWHEYFRQTAIDHPAWLAAMRIVTIVGAAATVAVVDTVLFAICVWRRRYRTAAFVAAVGLGGSAVRLVILNLVARPRPADALWSATGYSFPSGHATNGTLMLILIAVVFWPSLRSFGRIAMVIGATVVALAVTLSRVVGGVHWPTDVIGGLLVAVGCACLLRALIATTVWISPPRVRCRTDACPDVSALESGSPPPRPPLRRWVRRAP
jgi:undecaprenyl-diphosphatase